MRARSSRANLMRAIVKCGGQEGEETPSGTRSKLHAHQHPAHVRMIVKQSGRLARRGRTALTTLGCVSERCLKRSRRLPTPALRPRSRAAFIHDEHVGEACPPPHQVGISSFVEHDAGRRSMDAELVLDRRAARTALGPARSPAASGECADEEEGVPRTPGWRARRARGAVTCDCSPSVVIAPGDEDLLPGCTQRPVIASRSARAATREIDPPGPRSSPWPRSNAPRQDVAAPLCAANRYRAPPAPLPRRP